MFRETFLLRFGIDEETAEGGGLIPEVAGTVTVEPHLLADTQLQHRMHRSRLQVAAGVDEVDEGAVHHQAHLRHVLRSHHAVIRFRAGREEVGAVDRRLETAGHRAVGVATVTVHLRQDEGLACLQNRLHQPRGVEADSGRGPTCQSNKTAHA